MIKGIESDQIMIFRKDKSFNYEKKCKKKNWKYDCSYAKDLSFPFVVSHSVMSKQAFMTRWTVARQDPLCMEFSRHGYWSEFPFPFSWALIQPGIKPVSSTLQADSLMTWATSEAERNSTFKVKYWKH